MLSLAFSFLLKTQIKENTAPPPPTRHQHTQTNQQLDAICIRKILCIAYVCTNAWMRKKLWYMLASFCFVPNQMAGFSLHVVCVYLLPILQTAHFIYSGFFLYMFVVGFRLLFSYMWPYQEHFALGWQIAMCASVGLRIASYGNEYDAHVWKTITTQRYLSVCISPHLFVVVVAVFSRIFFRWIFIIWNKIYQFICTDWSLTMIWWGDFSIFPVADNEIFRFASM